MSFSFPEKKKTTLLLGKYWDLLTFTTENENQMFKHNIWHIYDIKLVQY